MQQPGWSSTVFVWPSETSHTCATTTCQEVAAASSRCLAVFHCAGPITLLSCSIFFIKCFGSEGPCHDASLASWFTERITIACLPTLLAHPYNRLRRLSRVTINTIFGTQFLVYAVTITLTSILRSFFLKKIWEELHDLRGLRWIFCATKAIIRQGHDIRHHWPCDLLHYCLCAQQAPLPWLGNGDGICCQAQFMDARYVCLTDSVHSWLWFQAPLPLHTLPFCDERTLSQCRTHSGYCFFVRNLRGRGPSSPARIRAESAAPIPAEVDRDGLWLRATSLQRWPAGWVIPEATVGSVLMPKFRRHCLAFGYLGLVFFVATRWVTTDATIGHVPCCISVLWSQQAPVPWHMSGRRPHLTGSRGS